MQSFRLLAGLSIFLLLFSCNNNGTAAHSSNDSLHAAQGKHASDASDTPPAAAAKKTVPEMRQPRVLDTTDKRPVVYLTFDDGPNNGTPRVLKVLKDNDVPATFFVIGLHVYGSPGQKRIWHDLQHRSDVLLCNHSYTHALRNQYVKFYNSPDTVIKDFKRNADSLHFDNKIGRTPGNNLWRLSKVSRGNTKLITPAAEALSKAGFKMVGWDLEWRYNKHLELTQTPDQLVAEVAAMVRNKTAQMPGHLVLLAHDHTFNSEKGTQLLDEFVRKLKATNLYRFEMLDVYPGL